MWKASAGQPSTCNLHVEIEMLARSPPNSEGGREEKVKARVCQFRDARKEEMQENEIV